VRLERVSFCSIVIFSFIIHQNSPLLLCNNHRGKWRGCLSHRGHKTHQILPVKFYDWKGDMLERGSLFLSGVLWYFSCQSLPFQYFADHRCKWCGSTADGGDEMGVWWRFCLAATRMDLGNTTNKTWHVDEVKKHWHYFLGFAAMKWNALQLFNSKVNNLNWSHHNQSL
jgi:hypothetical protein